MRTFFKVVKPSRAHGKHLPRSGGVAWQTPRAYRPCPMHPARPLPPLLSLRAFEAAARRLSFSHAAQELFVTQSAISHQIQKLEADLGVALFERRTRAIEL